MALRFPGALWADNRRGSHRAYQCVFVIRKIRLRESLSTAFHEYCRGLSPARTTFRATSNGNGQVGRLGRHARQNAFCNPSWSRISPDMAEPPRAERRRHELFDALLRGAVHGTVLCRVSGAVAVYETGWDCRPRRRWCPRRLSPSAKLRSNACAEYHQRRPHITTAD